MKIFHKQLFLLFFLLAGIFGLSCYYYFISLKTVVEELGEESAHLLANQFKAISDEHIKEFTTGAGWNDGFQAALRQALASDVSRHREVAEFFLVRSDSQVVFSLNIQSYRPRHAFLRFRASTDGTPVALLHDAGSDYYEAYWRPQSAQNAVAILGLNIAKTISDTRDEFTKKLYIIGIAGLVGIIFIAFISSRIAQGPIRKVGKAMTHIDKRKYGFRITGGERGEFGPVYQKVNLAMQRLEQLDSVQRTAVQKKNNLVDELKGLAQSMDIMAHEVKNPLHAMVINLDVLRTKIEKSRPKTEALRHLKHIEREVEHLKEVINGFLNYVRPGVPQKERMQVNEIIKDVCQMAAAHAEKRKIKIETRLGKGLRDVMLDREQIQQALHNLIINAIHASSDGSKIFVRSWAKRDKILIAVKDEGTGIPKEELSKIFDLYFTTKKDGSGIGLPVTKRIIEANGGRMQLESEVDKGTTATIMVRGL